MILALKSLINLYTYLNEIADPRIEDYFLMKSPWPGLALVCGYLLLVKRWLPEHMKTRQAFEIKPVIAAYNVLQIIGCAYVVYQSLVLCWFSHYLLVCQPVDQGPHGQEIAFRVCYVYFLLKLFDLVDTVFFVLRKKQNHVTFLHVYHHFGMVLVSWSIVKWVPGGHIIMLVTMNSFVHVVMYTYYLLTTLDESFKRSVWWKKHVTQLQIAQFSIILVHFIASLLAADCGFPRPPAYILIPQNLFIVILFVDFYYRTYIKKQNTK